MASLLTISSLVARGHVGNAATNFPLMLRGHVVASLPTVVLAHHPGHARTVARTEIGEIAALGRDVLASPRPHPVDGILIGYVPHAGQALQLAGIVAEARAYRPGAVLMVDPICADGGALYLDPAVVAEIASQILPMADIVTPNVTELAALTNPDDVAAAPIWPMNEVVSRARMLGVPCVVVTSAPASAADRVATLVVRDHSVIAIETPRVASDAHGTGDLMAGLILGEVCAARDIVEAVADAAAVVHDVMAATASAEGEELALIDAREQILKPRCQPVIAAVA